MFHTPNRNTGDVPNIADGNQSQTLSPNNQGNDSIINMEPQHPYPNQVQQQPLLQQSNISQLQWQDSGMQTQSSNSREINASALHKLPPFWSENPQLWFAQIESVFSLTGITRDETKFQHVIANMDPTVCEYISHIIFSPPTNQTKYAAVKEVLIKNFGKSDQAKIREILGGMKLGDYKPSQFMRKIRNLASEHLSAEAIKSIFIDEMPDQIRAVLCTMTDQSLDVLAEKADLIYSTFRQRPVFMVDQAQHEVNLSQEEISLTQLAAQVNQLSRHVEQLSSRKNGAIKKVFKGQDNEIGYCWYHRRFGNKASRCTVPCSFPKNEEGFPTRPRKFH